MVVLKLPYVRQFFDLLVIQYAKSESQSVVDFEAPEIAHLRCLAARKRNEGASASIKLGGIQHSPLNVWPSNHVDTIGCAKPGDILLEPQGLHLIVADQFRHRLSGLIVTKFDAFLQHGKNTTQGRRGSGQSFKCPPLCLRVGVPSCR